MAVVIGALSVLAALATLSADRSHQQERLLSQLSGVGSEVSSTLNSVQVPLLSTERVAQSFRQLSAVRSVASSQVDDGSPFRSLVLFNVSKSPATPLLTLGKPSDLLAASPGVRLATLSALRPSNRLQIVRLWRTPVRALGFVEYLPGGAFHRALYGEIAVPADSTLTIANTSPLYGLNFAMYLGDSATRRQLIESTLPTPLRGVVASMTIPFGNGSVTVVAVLRGESTPTLFAGTPLIIVMVGALCALAAAGTFQRYALKRLVRQRLLIDSHQQLLQERSVSQTLQRALLPDAYLDFPKLEIATAYRTGTVNMEVGGDWYDAFAVNDDTVLFAIGDVSGRGVGAATVMGSLRQAIRAFAMRGDDPATILSGLGSIVRIERDQCFATVLLMKLSTTTGELVVASAGHLAPVVVDARGSRLLELHISPPVGVDSAHVVTPAKFLMEPGTLLLAYTDGLVERRGEIIDVGLDRLTKKLTVVGSSIDRLVDSVLGDLVSDEPGDDVALLAIRILSDDEHFLGGCSRRFGGDVQSIGESRQFLDEVLRSRYGEVVSQLTREAAVLSVSELATNAVVHAQSAFRVRIDVGATGALRLAVTDDRGGAPTLRSSGVAESGGRGLRALDGLARAWGVTSEQSPSSTTVWAEFD
jgi:hypothetical protein